MSSATGRNSHLSIENKVLLYTAVMRPILVYASPVWGYAVKTNINILDTLQNSLIPPNQRATFKFTAKPKNSKTFHPDEAPYSRLPDSIVRPIAIMPLSRMENTTFVIANIIDYHDMGLKTVFTVRTTKE
ncbi:hypothetical protein TNCV_3594721 [Trichonephila clavipes]|nr:hypothetical protein TNCV_3594721 [Trichonephila clavipes]